MICTVTFNPSLDYVVSVENFRLGRTNRTDAEELFPGGKGINVSLVLKNLGVDSTALGFTAGFTGAEIESRLEKMGVHTDFIRLREGASRINVKLRSAEGTEINGLGPKIAEADLEELLHRLDGLQKGDAAFLSGSVPHSVPDDIYARIVRSVRERGVLAVVDAEGALLQKCLPCHPFLVKPNRNELGALFGTEIQGREDALTYGRKLQESGAENVLISLAGDGAVLLARDGQTYQAPAPAGTAVNATGAGDAMLAAFVADLLDGGTYEHAFYKGIAAGSASAFSVHFADAEQIDALFAQMWEYKENA